MNKKENDNKTIRESVLNQDATLEELKLIRLAYLQQGASVFTDLAMVTRRLGLSCCAPIYHDPSYFYFGTSSCVLYEVDEISAIWREQKIISNYHSESLIVTIGKPTLIVKEIKQPEDIQACSDQAIFREDVVCWLKRENLKTGTRSRIGQVETGISDVRFIPGKWIGKMLEGLSYAHELTTSMHEMNEERERLDMIRDLMIGRNI